MVEMPRQQEFANAASVAEAAPSAPAKSKGRGLKRTVAALALLAAAGAAGYYGYDYWTTGRFLVSTDDAYVKADYTTIAPKVAGYLTDVLVKDNQPVKAGQVLARIDDRDYRAALAQARAEGHAAEATIASLDAQIALQGALVDEARATIEANAAALTFAVADAERYRTLERTGAGTVQRAQQTESTRAQLEAQATRDHAALSETEKKIAVLSAGRQQAVAQHDRAAARVQQAELNLSYTKIVAPVSGVVGARSLRVGQYVTPGAQLMAVVPLQAAYVVANFKETQLADVRAGQKVEIEVDGLGGAPLKGHVDSLAPASGLEFALLPPDNATGNFTKIVQRIPVRIVFDDASTAGRLRAGMSVEPTIDTRAPARPRLPG
jgi:membrane fusion protein, multidrug efflux system